jgi:hypothetical protein
MHSLRKSLSETSTTLFVTITVFDIKEVKRVVHLGEGFQRRRLKCEKLMDDRCQVMAKAHVAFGKVS